MCVGLRLLEDSRRAVSSLRTARQLSCSSTAGWTPFGQGTVPVSFPHSDLLPHNPKSTTLASAPYFGYSFSPALLLCLLDGSWHRRLPRAHSHLFVRLDCLGSSGLWLRIVELTGSSQTVSSLITRCQIARVFCRLAEVVCISLDSCLHLKTHTALRLRPSNRIGYWRRKIQGSL